jgi:[protein-PII] uridylyltransferase
VLGAHAYCRRREDGQDEAVDLLLIRRLPNARGAVLPIRDRDVALMGETLDALVRGRATFDGAVRFARAIRASAASTRVRFEDDEREGITVLLVETTDRPGLLLAVTRALFAQRVQIVGSHVTTDRGQARDRFLVTELEGAPLKSARRLAIHAAVLAALEDPED